MSFIGMKAFLIILAAVGCLVGLLVALFAWRYIAAVNAGRRLDESSLERIEPIISDLEVGRHPEPALIDALAADAATRNMLYSALRRLGKAEMFPTKYRSLEAIGESDLVRWLLHPNELRARPNEIEPVKTVERTRHGRKCSFVVYRFRTHPPHWAAKSGWLAGVAGPYWEGEDPDGPPSGVFSKFESYESKSPEQHFEETEKLFERK